MSRTISRRGMKFALESGSLVLSSGQSEAQVDRVFGESLQVEASSTVQQSLLSYSRRLARIENLETPATPPQRASSVVDPEPWRVCPGPASILMREITAR